MPVDRYPIACATTLPVVRIEAGTRALITGASRGIGRALAVALAARGARVGLLSRTASELEALAAELPGEPVVLAADVGDRAAVPRPSRRSPSGRRPRSARRQRGRRALRPVHGAGARTAAERMTRVNWLGTLYTVQAGLPLLLDRAHGHVVVVSSGAGLRAFPGAAVYGATKAAQTGFAEALRHELSGTGVSLTTVFPGEIATSLHDHEHDKLPDWYRGGEPVGLAPAPGRRGDRGGAGRPPDRVLPAVRPPARRRPRRLAAGG